MKKYILLLLFIASLNVGNAQIKKIFFLITTARLMITGKLLQAMTAAYKT
jgi:hypothetical protein